MSTEQEPDLNLPTCTESQKDQNDEMKVVVEYIQPIAQETVELISTPTNEDIPGEVTNSIEESPSLDDEDNELTTITENISEGVRQEVVTPKHNRELKLLLALSKEANLDTNIAHKRKSVEPTAKLDIINKARNSSDPHHDLKPSKAELQEISTIIGVHPKGTEISSNDSLEDSKETKDKDGTISKQKKGIGGAVDENGRRSRKVSANYITMNNEHKDPFCWQCHHEDTTVFCKSCPRSFHHKCLKHAVLQPNHWMCPECATIMQAENVKQRSSAMQEMTLVHLCVLLKYALKRMLEVAGCEPFIHPVNDEDFPDYKNYIVHPMDLTCLDKNIKKNVYGSPQAFEADAKWIAHNSIIFNSYQSKLTSVAKSIMKICKQEMTEIENCATCYLNANTKKKTWFIEVCPKPHILVWAKLKGFPYWPAKAMRTNQSGLVDVRFFGAHDRAWIHYKECFLFSLKDPNSNKQKKNDIIQSVKELELYVDNLRKVYGQFQYAPYRVQFEPDQHMKQLQLMLPSYPHKLKLRKSVNRAKTNGTAETTDDSTPLNKQKEKELESNDSDPDEDMDETLAAHKTKLLGTSSGEELEQSSTNDTDSTNEIKSPSSRNIRGINLKMHGGKLKILPKIGTPESEKRKRFSCDDVQTPSKLARRNSDQSDTSLYSNTSDKINKLDITENMEISFGNKSLSSESIPEDEEFFSNSETSSDKRKSAIQVNFGLNETSEVIISPKNKSNICDQIMKKLVEPDDSSNAKQANTDGETTEVNDSSNVTESQTNEFLNELRNKSLTVLEKITELSPDTDIFDNPETNNDNKDFVQNIENMHDYSRLLCSEEIQLDDKDDVLSSLENISVNKSNEDPSSTIIEDDIPDKNAEDLNQTDTINTSVSIVHEETVQVESNKDSDVTSTSVEDIMDTEPIPTEKNQETENCNQDESCAAKTVIESVLENRTAAKSSQNNKNVENTVVNEISISPEEFSTPDENISIQKPITSNVVEFTTFQRGKVTLVNVDDIRKKNLDRTAKPPVSSQSILENRLISRRQSTQSDRDNSEGDSSVVVIKSEPSSEDEPSDTEYLEKKRKYLSALNISERMPKKPKTNEIRTRSKTEDRKFKIVDNISKVIDDVASHYSLSHANEEVTITRTSKKKEIFVKPLPSLQDLKPRARKSFPNIKNVYPSQKKELLKVCKSITTPISSTKSPQSSTTVTTKPSEVSVSATNNVMMIAPSPPTNTIALIPSNPPITYATNVAKPVLTMVQHPNGSTVGFLQPAPVSIAPVFTPTVIESQNYIPQSGANTTSVTVNATKNSLVSTSASSIGGTTNIVPLPIVTSSTIMSENPVPTNNVMEELQALTGSIPEPMSRSISEIMCRVPPMLKPRPPGPLSTQFSEGVPSSAGNVTSKINSISHRLSDYFRGMLIELLKDIGSSSNPEVEITRLKLENEELKHRHTEEILEIKKNISSVLKDMQKSLTDEKHRVVEETRAACELETVKRIEEAKSKQWCASCSKEAQFYCCWNTSYCDYPCQQKHWPTHMSKCTQQLHNSQMQNTPTSTAKTPSQQSLVLRQTTPPKGFKATIIGKSTKVLLNRPSINKVPISFARTTPGNHLTLVESTPGNYELVGNGCPISVNGKVITSLGKIKPGSVLSVTTTTSKPGLIQTQPVPSLCRITSTEGKKDGM